MDLYKYVLSSEHNSMVEKIKKAKEKIVKGS